MPRIIVVKYITLKTMLTILWKDLKGLNLFEVEVVKQLKWAGLLHRRYIVICNSHNVIIPLDYFNHVKNSKAVNLKCNQLSTEI